MPLVAGCCAPCTEERPPNPTHTLAVVVGPGDVMLSFGAFPADVPARVRFLHPLHNFALVSYDPQELSAEVRSVAGWTGMVV